MEHYIYHQTKIPKKQQKDSQTKYSFPPNIQHAKNSLHRCKNSCRTGFNSFTTVSRTSKPTSHTRKFTQGRIEIPTRDILKIKTPSSISEGASQWGIPRRTPKGEPRRNRNKKCIQIKAIRQYIIVKVAYCRGIPRVTPTSAPSKNDKNIN